MKYMHTETIAAEDRRSHSAPWLLNWWANWLSDAAHDDRYQEDPTLQAVYGVMCRELALSNKTRRVKHIAVVDQPSAETVCWHTRIYGTGGVDNTGMETAAALFHNAESDMYTLVYAWNDNTKQRTLEIHVG